MSTKYKDLIKLIAVILLSYLLLKTILLPKINSPQFQEFTISAGLWGYLVVVIYIVLSHVFAPIAGSPGVVLGVTIYGIQTGMWLLYAASIISSFINFYISRRYGRKYVIKLVGKDSMKKIDEYTQIEGKQVLILSRLFGFSLFDFISYAAGLTNIKFKDYYLITILCELFIILASQYIFRNVDFRSETGVMIWIISIFSTGVVFGLMINHYIKKHKQ